jgi:hypothetical protein
MIWTLYSEPASFPSNLFFTTVEAFRIEEDRRFLMRMERKGRVRRWTKAAIAERKGQPPTPRRQLRALGMRRSLP